MTLMNGASTMPQNTKVSYIFFLSLNKYPVDLVQSGADSQTPTPTLFHMYKNDVG